MHVHEVVVAAGTLPRLACLSPQRGVKSISHLTFVIALQHKWRTTLLASRASPLGLNFELEVNDHLLLTFLLRLLTNY